MTALARARVGDLSPQRYSFRLRAVDVDWLDMTAVSSVSLSVQKPSGDVETWSTVITATDEDELTGYHAYVSGDLDESGDYVIVPRATVVADISTGPVQFAPKTLKVFGLYE